MTKGKIRTNQFDKLDQPIEYRPGVTANSDNEVPSLGQVGDLADKTLPIVDLLTAQVGGGNQDFTTTQNYKAGSLGIYVAGPRILESAFSETGPNTFHLDVAPVAPDFVVARYLLDEVVDAGDADVREVIHRSGEVRISALKSDDSLVILDTSLAAADYYLPKIESDNDGFHLRLVRQGQFTVTLHPPEGSTIDGLPTYVIAEDNGAVELIYVYLLKRWIVITTGLHVIEHYPPANAAAHHIPISPTGESSYSSPPPPVTTEGTSYDKTFVFPAEGEPPISPTEVPYTKETAKVEQPPYPLEGSAGVSPPVSPYTPVTATLTPLTDFIEEPEVT